MEFEANNFSSINRVIILICDEISFNKIWINSSCFFHKKNGLIVSTRGYSTLIQECKIQTNKRH